MPSPSRAAPFGSLRLSSTTPVLLALGVTATLFCWLRLRDRSAARVARPTGSDPWGAGHRDLPGAPALPVRAESGGDGVIAPLLGHDVTPASPSTATRSRPDRRAAAVQVFVPTQRTPSD